MMKSTFKICQTVLLMCAVFGAGEDEVKSLTVMEGDSVTLNPDPNKIQEFVLILWRFGDTGSTIAQIDGNDISYPNHTKIFIDRLQLDQTGSLTITNMRTKHSGLYKLQIDHRAGTPDKQKFIVTVYESPFVIDASEVEIKSVSVIEGESVTLDVPQLYRDDLIVWRSGHEGKLIAKHDIEAKSSPLYYTDERFRDRVQLDHQTGSLTITNTRTTDSGLYTVKISSNNKQTLYRRFTVIVSSPRLSSGAVAGIAVVLLLVAAAAAAVVIYYRRKIDNMFKPEPVEFMEGDFAFLSSGVNEIKEGDQMLWTFGDEESRIAEMSKREKTTYFYDNKKRFRGRLQLDPQTGSLIIRNLRKTDSGLYQLQIKSKTEASYRNYKVTVSGEVTTLRVKEGEDVTLKFDHFTLQNVSRIKWFRDEWCIVSITENKQISESKSLGRFKDRLVLDSKTGFLTIKNLRPEHTGVYKVRSNYGYRIFNIIFDDSTENWSNESVGVFRETDEMKTVSIKKGHPLKLNTDTQIQPDDEILLMFGTVFKPRHPYEIIARINKPDIDEFKSAEKKFKELKLDHTGSVTISIKEPEAVHCGDYYVQITNKKNKSFKTCTFIVTDDEEQKPSYGDHDDCENVSVPLYGDPDD